MANNKDSKTKTTVLLVVMVILGILLLRQYLPAIQLPTDGAIQDEMLRLDSRQKDLDNARVVRYELGNELQRLRAKASGFWVRKRPGNAVEQEVLDEFNNIVRLAGINVQSREAKLIKTQNAMYVQEVEIHADIRGVTMKEFMRFLKEVESNPRRFHWSSCKIDPDNVNKPTGIRANCRLTAYLLSEDATRLLSSEAVAVETLKESGKTPAKTAGGDRRQSSSGARKAASSSDGKPDRATIHGNRRVIK
ncbi:MAG: hypothetical protein IJT83_01805 [Victivallales bacterium]|nr:hypothetical protein [Victivallales bacterium]MBR4222221.1 hypothetical protein [Victivallales bacterium]